MKRLLTLGSAAVLALALSSCGSAASSESAGTDAEASLNQLFERIDGTLQENQAAQLLARRSQQEAVQACMARHDQKYVLDVLDAPVWSPDTFRVGHGGTDWLQPLYDDLNVADRPGRPHKATSTVKTSRTSMTCRRKNVPPTTPP